MVDIPTICGDDWGMLYGIVIPTLHPISIPICWLLGKSSSLSKLVHHLWYSKPKKDRLSERCSNPQFHLNYWFRFLFCISLEGLCKSTLQNLGYTVHLHFLNKIDITNCSKMFEFQYCHGCHRFHLVPSFGVTLANLVKSQEGASQISEAWHQPRWAAKAKGLKGATPAEDRCWQSENQGFTLWLCQNSYWKWPFIVDLPIENGDFP